MVEPTSDEAVRDELVSLEHARCRAISELDVAALEQLLDEELTHTHVTGITQDRSAYLAGLAGRPRHTEPGSFRVRVHGEVAVLTGTLVNTFPGSDGAARRTELSALRVWRRADGHWRLWAFAASSAAGRPPQPERRHG